MMNHRFSLDIGGFFSERLRREAGENDLPAQVARAFALALGRPPDAEEAGRSVQLLQSQGLRAFCRALLNANELIQVN